MAHGGKREGAGRKKGEPNKKTKAVAVRAAAEGITPLEVIVAIMRERHEAKDSAGALAAATAAAPYMHPRLASVAVTGKDGGPLKLTMTLEQAVEADAELEHYRRERDTPLLGERDDPQGSPQVPG